MPKLCDFIKYGKLGGHTLAQLADIKSRLPQYCNNVEQLVDMSTFIGVEVEVENVHDIKASNFAWFWNTKQDNSLRNGGVEFVSLPMKGTTIVSALRVLFDDLPKNCQFSPRTSIHVHMDVRQLSPEELAKIVLVYLTVEAQLFDFAGEDRENNIFCVPWFHLGMTDSLFNSIKTLEKKQGHALQAEQYRYSALNLTPVTTFGTIEFRHLGGTNDVSRILSWINIILSIRKYALSKSLDDLIREIIELNTNSHYRAYAQQIFGELFYKFTNFGSIDKQIEKGVLSVKRALLSDSFLNELRPNFLGSEANKVLDKMFAKTKIDFFDVPPAPPEFNADFNRIRINAPGRGGVEVAPVPAMRWGDVVRVNLNVEERR